MLAKLGALTLVVGSLLSGACSTVGKPSTDVVATADIISSDGHSIGRAVLQAQAGELTLQIDVRGMPIGEHGLHLHATGRCDPPRFTTATGHLNPFAKMHGTMNPQGSHLGDLPNMIVKADGTGKAKAALVGSLGEIEPLILDGDGTAIVIHAAEDDYRTDPSGKSGDRIACGVFKATS